MRPWLTALGVSCALAGFLLAKQPVPLGGGQAVGSAVNLSSAAPRLPAAAPAAGSSVGSPFMKPYNPAKPLAILSAVEQDAALPAEALATATGGWE